MNLFLGSVGLVTLALGAIGIINIMLVAVAYRTHEIGLRKALGATKGSIMFPFFIEGAFLTLLSGGIGDGRCGSFDGGARHTAAASWIRHSQAGADDGGFGHCVARLFRSGCGFVSRAQSRRLATRGSATQE